MNPRSHPGARAAFLLAGGAVLSFVASCSTPLPPENERTLRRTIVESLQREIRQAEAHPDKRILESGPGIERLGIRPEFIPELEALAGPDAYADARVPMDADLLGLPQGVVAITLEQAVKSAVQNNLEVQFARLAPAISRAQVAAAEAAFDWVLFANADLAEIDEPRTTTSFTGSQGRESRDTQTLNFGLRRRLPTGAQLTIQQEFARNDLNPAGSTRPNPADSTNLTLRLDQPLLEGFGPDVNLAQIRLAQNAEREQVAELKRELIRIVTETERTYWELVQAHRDLLILQRLLDRGIETQRIVQARQEVDAIPAQVADANARVEDRRNNVLRAQNILRDASDRLKVLMNDPQLTIGSEVLLLPVDTTIAEPVAFSLLEAIMTAVRYRPEVQRAILSLDNTSIRQMLADNQRLPQLDLRLQTRFSGLDDDMGGSLQEEAEAEFIDYLVGLVFEQPLGNKGAEALFRQRQLERLQATIAYRNTLQQVALEVKRALRTLATNYRLIEGTRVQRYAATENLRSFEVQLEGVRGFGVELLDLLFRRQEALAQAERLEVEALVDYNIALANLAAAMGTALERNRIDFVVADAFDVVPWDGTLEDAPGLPRPGDAEAAPDDVAGQPGAGEAPIGE